jgi:hypothetical protein
MLVNQLLKQRIKSLLDEISDKLGFSVDQHCSLNDLDYQETDEDQLMILFEFLTEVDRRLDDLIERGK